MGSTVRKIRRVLPEEKVHSRVVVKVNEERLSEILETASLKNMPLEERRREANKPLYLVRYE